MLELELEIDAEAVFFVNSDMDKFIDSFLILDAFLRFGAIPDESVEAKLAAIDPQGYPKSQWRGIFEELSDLSQR
ncbi:MAG TPA: hypothetical protein VEZ90_04085 [Blastocatellia bacterium]|nr:hypothetical protein [Blastocatellia bacterium]